MYLTWMAILINSHSNTKRTCMLKYKTKKSQEPVEQVECFLPCPQTRTFEKALLEAGKERGCTHQHDLLWALET